jgi:hypothetical protein
MSMTIKRIRPYVLVILPLSLFAAFAVAQEAFFDDFGDGDIRDNSPVTWSPLGSSTLTVEDGDLVVSGNFGLFGLSFSGARVLDRQFGDVSLRTQAALNSADWIALTVRDAMNPITRQYVGDISRNGHINVGSLNGGPPTWAVQALPTGLNPGQEDVVLQIDAIGDDISFWAWASDEDMPSEPLFTYKDSRIDGGIVTVNFGSLTNQDTSGVLRFVQVDTKSISDPFSPGDFDHDGLLDVSDIDALTSQSAGGQNNVTYDLNNDALVNESDVAVWVMDLKSTWIGDADLNGVFNSADLINVLAAGTYETDIPSVWSAGDFNGDGRTDSGDLIVALADGGYEQGPRAAANAVPEPQSFLVLMMGLFGVAIRRRHFDW